MRKRNAIVAAVTVAATLVAIALWWPGLPKAPLPRGAHPNIVVVIGCTLRADQTTPYQPELPTTPFLATLSRDGVRFADGFTQAAWTRPGATALLTGRHPAQVGLVERGAGRNDRGLAPEVVTLAERLREGGYRTIGVTANPNLDPHFGFEQGFESYHSLADLWREGELGKVSGAEAVEAAIEAVVRDPDPRRPLYLQVLLVDAHQPYRLGAAAAAAWEGDGVSERVARYRAMLTRFDQSVAGLEQALAWEGYTAENTIFAVVNDHGEGLRMPEHHSKGHGRFLYPSTTGLFWVMRGPDIAPGHVVDGLSAQIDVVPTLLALADLPADPTLPGIDLSALARGDGSRSPTQRVFSSTRFDDVDRAAVFTPDRACFAEISPPTGARTERRTNKPDFVPGCFDRLADPDYTDPFEDPELTAEVLAWRAAIDAELAGWDETVREVTLPPGLSEALRALGYVDEGSD